MVSASVCWLTLMMTSASSVGRSEEHTSELQSQSNLVCRLLLEKKKKCFSRRATAPWYSWTGFVVSKSYSTTPPCGPEHPNDSVRPSSSALTSPSHLRTHSTQPH